MSGVYLVTCDSCAYSQGLKFGIGAMYSSLERAILLVHPQKRSQVIEISYKTVCPKEKFECRAHYCSTSNDLYDRLWVRIDSGARAAYETEVNCGKCGKRMNPITDPETIEVVPCPIRYNTSLGLIKAMPWN